MDFSFRNLNVLVFILLVCSINCRNSAEEVLVSTELKSSQLPNQDKALELKSDKNKTINSRKKIPQLSPGKKPQSQNRYNFASSDAGASVLEVSPFAKEVQTILNRNDDKYMMMPANKPKWFVVQLSEDIMVDCIEITNLEHYSAGVRQFKVGGSANWPVDNWKPFGVFTAKNSLKSQKFSFQRPKWARFLRVDIISHYRDEVYCTLTQFKVHGSTIIEKFHKAMETSLEGSEKSSEKMENENQGNSTVLEKENGIFTKKVIKKRGSNCADKFFNLISLRYFCPLMNESDFDEWNFLSGQTFEELKEDKENRLDDQVTIKENKKNINLKENIHRNKNKTINQKRSEKFKVIKENENIYPQGKEENENKYSRRFGDKNKTKDNGANIINGDKNKNPKGAIAKSSNSFLALSTISTKGENVFEALLERIKKIEFDIRENIQKVEILSGKLEEIETKLIGKLKLVEEIYVVVMEERVENLEKRGRKLGIIVFAVLFLLSGVYYINFRRV